MWERGGGGGGRGIVRKEGKGVRKVCGEGGEGRVGEVKLWSGERRIRKFEAWKDGEGRGEMSV